MERFSFQQVLEILHLKPSQLRYWERLKLIQPERLDGERIYSLQDLISMRTILRLQRDNVPATRLRDVLQCLAEDEALATKKPLVELNLRSLGGDVVHDWKGRWIHPVTGQQVFNLDAPAAENVTVLRPMGARDWLAAGMQAESRSPAEAQQAYEEALRLDRDLLEAYINLGTLHFKKGDLAAAEACYREVLSRQESHATARFNLANVLDERGLPEQALAHLQKAIELRPGYADAHFNLAMLLEKLERPQAARLHWQEYLRLDPGSEWAALARKHLAALPPPADGSSKVVPLRRRRQ